MGYDLIPKVNGEEVQGGNLDSFSSPLASPMRPGAGGGSFAKRNSDARIDARNLELDKAQGIWTHRFVLDFGRSALLLARWTQPEGVRGELVLLEHDEEVVFDPVSPVSIR